MQKEREFVKSDYGKMIKTYSIWICFNLEENCLNYLHMVNEPVLGTIFSSQLTATEKIELLNEKDKVIEEKNQGKEISDMFSFADMLVDQVMERGMEQGKRDLIKRKYEKVKV